MPQGAMIKKTGQAGSVKFTPPGTGGSSTTGGPGVMSQIYDLTWSANVDRKMVENTDASNYDGTTGVLWGSQQAVKSQIKGTIEANVDFNIFQTVIVPAMSTSQPSGGAGPRRRREHDLRPRPGRLLEPPVQGAQGGQRVLLVRLHVERTLDLRGLKPP